MEQSDSIDAEMETVSDEMEVTAGLIQKLVDENATRKLDQHDYRKKYDGYASWYAVLESQMDCLEKERERKEIQYDIFSDFLAGLGETEELPVDFKIFKKPSVVRTWTLRIIAVLIAGYGIYAFIHRGIGRYMLMLDHFVFFDFDEPIIFFIVDYIAVMGMLVFVGHYVAAGLKLRSSKHEHIHG